MGEHRIRALIAAAGRRSAGETAALVAALAATSWPRGGDRRDPVAAEWLRRWAPATMPAGAAECGCASGRCTWCN